MSMLHILTSDDKKKKRRLGQGHGSGRVKTSGRGTKGQKARNSVPLRFEGGALPLIKRLPFRRGKGRNNVFKIRPIGLNVKVLSLLPANSIVDLDLLIKHNIIDGADARRFGVKLLGDGEVTNVYTVKLPMTKGAHEKVTQAGGSVETL